MHVACLCTLISPTHTFSHLSSPFLHLPYEALAAGSAEGADPSVATYALLLSGISKRELAGQKRQVSISGGHLLLLRVERMGLNIHSIKI